MWVASGSAPLQARSTGAASANVKTDLFMRDRELSERLSIAHRALDLDEAEGLVRSVRGDVVEQGVGSELAVATTPRPLLSSADERGADAATAHVGVDVPPLEVAHGARLAPVGVRTRPHLGESGQGAVIACGDDDARVGPREPFAHAGTVALGVVIGPE